MEVFEAIQKRYSCRSYLEKEIPQDSILKILEAARLAPSASNIQPWYFIVVTDKEKRKKIAKSGRWASFVEQAPVVIVGCGDAKASPKWYKVDVSIAMEHMVLEATELGLGTCWIGSFDEKLVKELLNIPGNYEVVALLSVGYASKGIDLEGRVLHLVKSRKRIEEIAGFNEYGKTLL
jgi:nitroreductase